MAFEIIFSKDTSQNIELIQFVANELDIVLKDPNGQFRGILEWTYNSAKRKQSEVKIIRLRLTNKAVSCVKYYCTGNCNPCDMRPSSALSDKDQLLFNEIVNDILDKKAIPADVFEDSHSSVRKGLVRC